MTTALKLFLCGLFSLAAFAPSARASAWTGFPIAITSDYATVSNCVRQLIAAADERKTLLCGTTNPVITNESAYIEITNAWISAYVDYFPGMTTTTASVTYSNANSNWTVTVTNYYVCSSNITFTNEVRADKIPALLKAVDALTILFLATKSVADRSKMIDGTFSNYCAPYLSTSGTWNASNTCWDLTITTNAGLTPPAHTPATFVQFLSTNLQEGSPLFTNFISSQQETPYSNNVEGWTVGQSNVQYVAATGVSTTFQTYSCVLHQPRRLVKPFPLGEAVYEMYNWLGSNNTMAVYWPTWIDLSSNLLTDTGAQTNPFPNIGTLVFTGFVSGVIPYVGTNTFPVYQGMLAGAVVTSAPPESIVTTNPATPSGWAGMVYAGTRANPAIYLSQSNFFNPYVGGPWLIMSSSRSWGSSAALNIFCTTNPAVSVLAYTGGAYSGKFVMQLGWKYTRLNNAYTAAMNTYPEGEIINNEWVDGYRFLWTTNGYLPGRIEYQADTNHLLDFPGGSQLTLTFWKHRDEYHIPEYDHGIFAVYRMSVGRYTNTFEWAGSNIDLADSILRLESIAMPAMNVLVTNTLDGRYTNAYRSAGATITVWASNTYDVYTVFSPYGASYGRIARTMCAEQLNARYYMLKYLDGTWEDPAVSNGYKSCTGPGYSTSVTWAAIGGYPATTNNFLDWASWFSGPEADALAYLTPYTNEVAYSLVGAGLAAHSDGVTANESSHWGDVGMEFSASVGEHSRLGEEHTWLHAPSKIKGKTATLYRKAGAETITLNGTVTNRPLEGYRPLRTIALATPGVHTNFPLVIHRQPEAPWLYYYEPLNGQDLGVGDSDSADYWDGALDDWTPWNWMTGYSGVYGQSRSISYLFQKQQNFYKALVYWDFEY
jgi:hypothetical protein